MALHASRGTKRVALTDATTAKLTTTVLGREIGPAQALRCTTGGTIQVKGPSQTSFVTHTLADNEEIVGEFVEYDLTAGGAATGVVAIY